MTEPTNTMNETEAHGPRVGRRGLIIGGLAVAGGTLAGPAREYLPFIGKSEPLVRSALAAHVGERFVVRRDGGDVELEVASISELPDTAVSNPDGQFGVRFRSRRTADLPQGTYELTSGAFGTVALFLSPLAEPGNPVTEFEALFNSPESEVLA